MRKVPLSKITSDMYLAKSIYHYNYLLLREGANDLIRYKDNLAKLGITSIYVLDHVSHDIEIPDIVSEETRFKCKDTLQDTFMQFQKEGSFDMEHISNAIESLLEELLNRPDVLISLNDIGTTDDNTLVHSVNTTVFSLLLAESIGMSKLEMKKLGEGILLHDIGKTLLKSKILYKPDILTFEEFEYVKLHTSYGYNVLKKNPFLTELSRLVSLQHHERLDGSGYPYGLKGNEIHTFSKIAAITDMYDALTAERCYRTSMTNYQAYQVLMENSAVKLDADLLAKFLQKIAIYPNGTLVNLSDGTHGIIKAQTPNMPFNPIVRVIDDRYGEAIQLYDLNLMDVLNVTILN